MSMFETGVLMIGALLGAVSAFGGFSAEPGWTALFLAQLTLSSVGASLVLFAAVGGILSLLSDEDHLSTVEILTLSWKR